jgi:hypothetical protein
MNSYDKKHPFFNDSLAKSLANCESYFSSNMKILTIFLFLFSGLCFNIEAFSLQVPAKSKPAVSTTKPANPVILKILTRRFTTKTKFNYSLLVIGEH